MLQDKTPLKIPIDRNSVMLKHGSIGLKMIFVCDIFEELQRSSSELGVLGENILYINKKQFYDFIFNLDIFIFELYSILDYFALEVAEILKFKKNIRYFTDLKKVRFNQTIKQKIDFFMNQNWFNYFHKMRIRIVHRLPINFWALIHGEIVEFPFFPDDPLNIKSVSNKKLEPLIECQKWLEEVFNFIDEICSELVRELFVSI